MTTFEDIYSLITVIWKRLLKYTFETGKIIIIFFYNGTLSEICSVLFNFKLNE